MKTASPLVGFNNNVKHRGRVFHVQTEDSGAKRPHITTHLFADGGRIVQSTRTDYSEHVGQDDMTQIVRRLMKEQHKAMFIALRDGRLDARIDEVLVGAPEAKPEVAPAPKRSVPPPKPARRRSRPPPTLADTPAVTPPPTPPVPAEAATPRAAQAPTLTDLVLQDLGAPRTRPAGAPTPAEEASLPPPLRGGTPVLGTPPVSPVRSRHPSGRYAAPRPAALFTGTPEQGSIFGTTSISEQSLDEVILSYLAEDLDAPEER